MPNSDRLPVYHAGSGPAQRDELLLATMSVALTSYCEIAGDIARGAVVDEYDSWVDFDSADAFTVTEVTAANLASSGLPVELLGRLVVWYDATALCVADSLASAQALIEAACGVTVLLIEDDISGPYWWVEPIDHPDAPVEPPLPPLTRTARN